MQTALDGGVFEIALDEPARRNALTTEMVGALLEAIRAVPADAGSVMLHGTGRVFCAGFDLDRVHEEPDVLGDLLLGLSRCIVALRDLDQPVTVAAHGAAIAGGCALLGGADIVVADRGAKLGYPVTRLGISPAVSAPFLGLRLAGRSRAALLEPTLFDGVRGHELGLVDILVDDPGEVIERARASARTFTAEGSRHARAATRAWLREIEDAVSTSAHADEALACSLSLVGNDESRACLAQRAAGR